MGLPEHRRLNEYVMKDKMLSVSELGRLGGLASAKALTRGERVEKARAAARARWAGHRTPATPLPVKRVADAGTIEGKTISG